MPDIETYRTTAAAEAIAYIAWRYRNPAAGTFRPSEDRGHREVLDGAKRFLQDPRPFAFKGEK